MKYILRAIGEEVLGFLCLAVVLGLLAGVGWLLHWAFGDGAMAVGVLLLIVVLQVTIVVRRAAELKGRERPHE